MDTDPLGAGGPALNAVPQAAGPAVAVAASAAAAAQPGAQKVEASLGIDQGDVSEFGSATLAHIDAPCTKYTALNLGPPQVSREPTAEQLAALHVCNTT